MTLVPLNPAMTNRADFVNSLFSADVRDAAGLQAAIAAGALSWSYADPASRGLILRAWLEAWRRAAGLPDDSGAPPCPAQDAAWIAFVCAYLARNDLDLCTPRLSLHGLDARGRAIYKNSGYQRTPFLRGGTWQLGAFDAQGSLVGDPSTSTVARFLEHLYYGSHIVVILSPKDIRSVVRDLRDDMADALPVRTDEVSSHYGGSAVLSGRYYCPDGAPRRHGVTFDVETLAVTGAEPLLLALLVGVTASTNRNEFLQLEGWPAQESISPPGGERHNADYEANEATYWNFSTFGASACTEKRSTPVFLAPADFSLTLQADTKMPHYWGANAGNVGDAWMHPDLVVL
jgi:hypothetical protein